MSLMKTVSAQTQSISSDLQIDDLTNQQRQVLTRITGKFRESGVVQVLTGPEESGKSLLANLVSCSLSEECKTILITKDGDLPPAQKRLMQEAYGSYTHLLSAMLRQIGFAVRGQEADLVDQLVEHLRNVRKEGKRLLLIIDDAQDLTPGVWKRLHPWLDYQDMGVRMVQILLVGTPLLTKMLGEPVLRPWRRWVHGSHELNLLRGSKAREEIRHFFKRECERLTLASNSLTPIPVPKVTWFAHRILIHESEGCPGRLNELVKRVLSAAIRQDVTTITRRFLKEADALRSTKIQPYKMKQAKYREEATSAPVSAPPTAPVHPFDWLRYAFGVLLLVFIIGAGWGIRNWMNQMPPHDTEAVVEASSNSETPALPPLPAEDDLDALISIPSVPAPEAQVAQAPSTPQTEFDPFATTSSEQFTQAMVTDLSKPMPLDATAEEWNPLTEVAKSQTFSASMEQELGQIGTDLTPAPVTSIPAASAPPRDPLPVTAAPVEEPPSLKETESSNTSVVEAPPMEPEPPRVQEPAPPKRGLSETERMKKKKALEALMKLEAKLKS